MRPPWQLNSMSLERLCGRTCRPGVPTVYATCDPSRVIDVWYEESAGGADHPDLPVGAVVDVHPRAERAERAGAAAWPT